MAKASKMKILNMGCRLEVVTALLLLDYLVIVKRDESEKVKNFLKVKNSHP